MRCPKCRSPNCYLGLFKHNCPNSKCVYYDGTPDLKLDKELSHIGEQSSNFPDFYLCNHQPKVISFEHILVYKKEPKIICFKYSGDYHFFACHFEHEHFWQHGAALRDDATPSAENIYSGFAVGAYPLYAAKDYLKTFKHYFQKDIK